MIIFTSVCANYMHKARCLAQSVRRFLPEAKFLVCLTEREVPEAAVNPDLFDEIILSKDMWKGNFNSFIFKHAVVEASTAVKGRFFQYLMERFPEEDSYIYLDPDCYVYGDFQELKEALAEKPIVLCPHLLHPGNIDMELSSTAHGVYNLGFLAVNHSEEAHRLINWWAERLSMYCYDDIPKGIFTDQKWMDLAPCFFDVKIMHHYGYDFAPWGLLGAEVHKKDDTWYIQGQKLNFIHYSGFGPVAEMCMDKWLGENGQEFRILYEEYAQAHAKNDEDNISKTPWSYNTFASGELIQNEVRHRYRQDMWLMQNTEDPFQLNNAYFVDYFSKLDAQREREMEAVKHDLTYYAKASVRVLREEGFNSFLKKVAQTVGKK